MHNIYLHLPELITQGESYSLATVVTTSGSTPQKPGNSALFNLKGRVEGTVGGGILEARVQEEAIKMAGKGAALFTYDLDNSIEEKGEAICGGSATVLIDGNPLLHEKVYREVALNTRKRIVSLMVTRFSLNKDNDVSVERFVLTGAGNIPAKLAAHRELISGLIKSTDPEAFGYIAPSEKGDDGYLLEPLFPPERLIIAGAGHIGKALCHYGKRLGFEVTVIDDRLEYACAENLPEADRIICGDIGRETESCALEEKSYIVIVTRGHAADAEALKSCIGKKNAYVGMIGSRTKIARMKREFIDSGIATEEQWKGIYAPVGISIGSKTVEEIAVSIAAQLIQVRNNPEKG